ncbi:MAG: BtaA family protein [Planctomycetota bacterium]|nr:BtaA family protein [Planctomycetota bacterium]MCX8040461.1 BtaA family protein [Planctomycetota bacterium]MDW8373209.1 BtaA family protein [Planctomycetota bacterium]
MSSSKPGLAERVHQRLFAALYRRTLLYNACWEDPALDRVALALQPQHRVLVITSGGCNALDYALCGPREVVAVDANPRQTALLELKIAGIRALDYDDFFRIFGEGWHPAFRELYLRRLRPQLSEFARQWWDRRLSWFSGRGWRSSFYYHGLSGLVARLMRTHIAQRPRLRRAIDDLLVVRDLAEQRRIYDQRVHPALWTRAVRWAVSRQATMSLLGVPTAQSREVRAAHAGGISGYIIDAIATVFRQLPLWTNYFWTVYLRGSYTRSCCPEYLTAAGFAALQAGLVERVRPVTDTVAGFLARCEQLFDRFILLDHQDWLGAHQPAELAREWGLVLARAAPGARAIWRSAHPQPAYLADLRLPDGSALAERLVYHRELAAELHRRDRVGTYGGFHIADLRC